MVRWRTFFFLKWCCVLIFCLFVMGKMVHFSNQDDLGYYDGDELGKVSLFFDFTTKYVWNLFLMHLRAQKVDLAGKPFPIDPSCSNNNNRRWKNTAFFQTHHKTTHLELINRINIYWSLYRLLIAHKTVRNSCTGT